MSSTKVAVVTGSNKGIGFAIVKGLCKRFPGVVYLTSRDVSRGEEAVKKIEKLGFKPLYHQLDITDQTSIDDFKNFIETTYGGLDLLVNNAAIAFKEDAIESFGDQAEETLKVNYFSTLNICEAVFPLLRQNAKVVNLACSSGHLSRIPSTDLRSKLSNPDLTITELNELMETFVRDAKDRTAGVKGWGNSTYVVSKVGLTALTFIQQRLFDKEEPNRNISVNAVHPGYVDTDMTSHKGPLTIEEGAKAPLFLALDADWKGKYVWFDCKEVDWYGNAAP